MQICNSKTKAWGIDVSLSKNHCGHSETTLLANTKQVEETSHGNVDTALIVEASYYRNQAMYRAIFNASRAGFVMAGIGNNHLVALRPALTGIPNITYNEYTGATVPEVNVEDPYA